MGFAKMYGERHRLVAALSAIIARDWRGGRGGGGEKTSRSYPGQIGGRYRVF